jgi:hypothetical protein
MRRTWSASSTLTLSGPQNYPTLNADAGTTHVTGSFTGGTATVNVAATLNFGANQTLAALNIAAGAVVTLDESFQFGPAVAGDDGGMTDGGDLSPLSSQSGVQAVPEPGSLSLLLLGVLGIAGRRLRPRRG